MKYSAVLAAVGALGAGTAFAQEPIKIGVLYPLTGGGAVYGVPAMAGHQLAVEELNAKGGIMGRKIESIERDDKLNPAAASSTMKELITKDKVDIVLGGLASSVGLAMSEVSKQEKVVYISTIPKTIQMTTDKLHKYVFRTASNTDLEGDTMALLVGKNKLSKLCHLELDYAYGNDLEVGILKALPKYAPDAKVVLTLKPKLGATDFNPFIPQVMAAGCDGVISGLWGPHFVSWVKQAAPLGFFDKIKWISGGEIGSHEIAGELKGEYPDNVISNTYELWYHGNDPSHAGVPGQARQEAQHPGDAAVGDAGLYRRDVRRRGDGESQVDRRRQGRGRARGPDDRHAGRHAHHRCQDAPGQHRPVLGADGQEARPRLPHDGAGGVHPAEVTKPREAA